MPTVFWLIAGVLLCLVELVVPTAFTASVMGVSALIVGAISLVLPQAALQIALWMGLSMLLIFLVQRFVPKTKAGKIQDAIEAQTLTEILPGQTGRVRYEGNSWRARCADDHLAIAPDQKVYVVRREGTTLVVLPEHIVHLEP
ncbi:MAG: NfeD family protein [Leptolyngbyaceae bacterium]|nr:NfeD family protein [Leptolyngbyaceae bacterium]